MAFLVRTMLRPPLLPAVTNYLLFARTSMHTPVPPGALATLETKPPTTAPFVLLSAARTARLSSGRQGIAPLLCSYTLQLINLS